ncbi:hypothetical protein CKM354_001074900 [Cercospora kikuchii]|uniref:Uncharacterized protein n=1 Tax=Cercospora kikuchii TaxID=84275 RepID=A0A9P3CN92_9PEZI|nr:uncharacterized protein CKM354_001074900 [Cercospora kikuchii]GIZ47664.1 hypothetical protein CKM354_001074900 [Cercospora kikuchii]
MMLSFGKKWLHVFALLALTFVLATGHPQKRAIIPAIDPFYKPPAGIDSAAPGEILRTRRIIPATFGLIPTLGVEAHQLLYRTTAVDGSAIAAVTTVFRPLIAKADRFVSFHTAYDAAATICNPSYTYQLGAIPFNLITSVEYLLLQAFLASGYIVSSPDYEGPDAAFSAGRLSGTAVLDSMRAVKNFRTTLRLSTSTPKIVGYGYSGGSIASGWAAQLNPTYAPDVTVSGWAAGGIVANLTGTAVFIDNTLFSGFLPVAFAGLNKPTSYAARLDPVIDRIITPAGQAQLDSVNQNCATQLFTFAEQSVLSTNFQSLGDQVLYQEDIASVLAQQTMGQSNTEKPIAPVYVFHASNDEIIPYANATTLVNSWCSKGVSVDYVTYAAGGHATTEIVGFVGAFQFLEKAFAGTLGSGCTTSTKLDETLNPLALGLNLEPILVRLIDALAALGRGDANLRQDLRVLDTKIET